MKLGKNKKGFTMVELLATILIVGILSSIGIVSVVSLRKNQEKKFNENQYKVFVETAKTYFTDNKQYLPQEPLGNEYVTLEELKSSNYLTDDFVDYKGNQYSNESRVTAVRMGNGRYGYYGVLTTTSGNDYTAVKANASVTFEYSNESNRSLNKLNNKYYTNKSVLIKTIVSSDKEIGAYMYIIYKDGVEYKRSEAEYLDYTTTFNKNIKIDMKEETDAKYKLKIILYDKDGIQINKNSDDIVLDRVPPTKPELVNANENRWTNESYSISGTSSDKTSGIYNWQYTYKSGADKSVVSENSDDSEEKWVIYPNSSKNSYTTTEFSRERNQYVYISACDYAGNCSSNSKSMIKIDKTAPTKPVLNNPNSGWVNKVRFDSGYSYVITGTTVETLSGVNYWQYTYSASASETGTNANTQWITYANSATTEFTTTPFTANRNQNVYIRVCDKAGNCSSNNSSMIKIDRIDPGCSSSGGSTDWTKTSRTLVGTCSDSGSGCKQASANGRTYDSNGNVSWIINSEGNSSNISPGIVYDNAGNSTQCPANQTVRIDRTPPDCGSWSGGSNTWNKNSRNIYVGCSDGISGCTAASYLVATYSGDQTIETVNLNKTISDNAGNTKACTNNNYPIYYDHQAPSCVSSGGSTDWTDGYRKLVGTCNDNGGSGCLVAEVEKKVDNEGNHSNLSPGTVCDNLDNCSDCPANQTARIDHNPPSCTIKMNKSTNDGKTYNSGSLTCKTIKVTVTCSDATSGCKYVNVSGGGGQSVNKNSNGSTIQFSITERGITELNVSVRDNAEIPGHCNASVYKGTTSASKDYCDCKKPKTCSGDCTKYSGWILTKEDDLRKLLTSKSCSSTGTTLKYTNCTPSASFSQDGQQYYNCECDKYIKYCIKRGTTNCGCDEYESCCHP